MGGWGAGQVNSTDIHPTDLHMGVGGALESGGGGERKEGQGRVFPTQVAHWLTGEAGLGWLKVFLKTLTLVL